MKKYVISTLVISTFLIYVLYERTMGINTVLPTEQSLPIVATDSVNVPIPVTPVTGNTNQPISPVVPAGNQVSTVSKPKGQYKDGQYTGDSADAYYGNVQVQAVIQNGKISDVVFLDHPQDRGRSVSINNRAMPILKQEAIQVQSANVNTVSGATDSSGAFKQSLESALAQARN